jgi:hypothetical protein
MEAGASTPTRGRSRSDAPAYVLGALPASAQFKGIWVEMRRRATLEAGLALGQVDVAARHHTL